MEQSDWWRYEAMGRIKILACVRQHTHMHQLRAPRCSARFADFGCVHLFHSILASSDKQRHHPARGDRCTAATMELSIAQVVQELASHNRMNAADLFKDPVYRWLPSMLSVRLMDGDKVIEGKCPTPLAQLASGHRSL